MLRFRCIHCGEYFTLQKDEQQEYENGYFDHEPDTCDECSHMDKNEPDDYSDADSGL